MNNPQGSLILRHVRKLAAASQYEGQSDAELLRGLVNQADEAAFETLLRRHGPMVFQVAQRVLRSREDAEDVFQAVFLTLARKAGSIRKGGSLGPWLHGVAHRLALQAQRAQGRRQAHERRAAKQPASDPVVELTLHDAQKVLDEELQQLADRYRAPLVLCYLEGSTRDEAARQLGWSLGTLKRRLERARALLRKRLTARGLTMPAALTAILLGEESVPAALSGSLLQSTLRLGLLLAQGKSATAETLSANVIKLMSQASGGVGMSKLHLTVLWLGVGLFTTGAGVLAHQGTAGRRAAAEPTPVLPQQAVEENKSSQPAARTDDYDDPLQKLASQELKLVTGPPTDRYGDPLPEEAISRLGTLRLRAQASSLLFAPDGKSLFSLGNQGLDRWDVATGKRLSHLPGHAQEFRRLLSPDGTLLASVSLHPQGPTISLSNPATGALLRRFGNEPYDGLCFSPDGKLLASFGNARPSRPQTLVELWNVATGEQVQRCTGHQGRVSCAVFMPDGKTLASGGDDRAIVLWDVATGREIRRMTGSSVAVSQLAISPDGSMLASIDQLGEALGRESCVRIWDMKTGTEIRQLDVPAINDAPGWPFTAVLFTADGKRLVIGGADRYARLLDVTTGQELKRFDVVETHPSCLALSRDSTVMAVGSPLGIRLIELATGKDIVPLAGHRNPVFRIAITAGKDTIVTASAGPTFLQWVTATGQLQRQVGAVGETGFNYFLTQDGSSAFSTAWKEPGVCVWDLRAGKKTRRLLEDYAEKPPQMIALSADGKKLALSSLHGGPVEIVDTVTGKILHRLQDPNIHAWGGADFDARGQTLAIYCRDDSVRLWDFAKETQPRKLMLEHEGLQRDESGYHPILSPDGKLLAYYRQPKAPIGGPTSSMQTHRLVILDVATGTKLPLAGDLPRGSLCMTFSHDSRVLAWNGDNENRGIYLLEVASGKLRHRYQGHSDYIVSLAFSADGKMLVSGGLDTTALVWDLTGSRRKQPAPNVPLSNQELNACWTNLASEDAASAYETMRKLERHPALVVPFLTTRLEPVPTVPPADVKRLLADLGSDQFAVRDKAAAQLIKLRDLALPYCREALAAQPSAEVRRRLEEILQASPALSADQLRQVRTVELLEWIGSMPASRLLERIAQGMPHARLTQEAQASLVRLEKKDH